MQQSLSETTKDEHAKKEETIAVSPKIETPSPSSPPPDIKDIELSLTSQEVIPDKSDTSTAELRIQPEVISEVHVHTYFHQSSSVQVLFSIVVHNFH